MDESRSVERDRESAWYKKAHETGHRARRNHLSNFFTHRPAVRGRIWRLKLQVNRKGNAIDRLISIHIDAIHHRFFQINQLHDWDLFGNLIDRRRCIAHEVGIIAPHFDSRDFVILF